jgi:hypothetical protein
MLAKAPLDARSQPLGISPAPEVICQARRLASSVARQ